MLENSQAKDATAGEIDWHTSIRKPLHLKGVLLCSSAGDCLRKMVEYLNTFSRPQCLRIVAIRARSAQRVQLKLRSTFTRTHSGTTYLAFRLKSRN